MDTNDLATIRAPKINDRCFLIRSHDLKIQKLIFEQPLPALYIIPILVLILFSLKYSEALEYIPSLPNGWP